MRRMSSENLRIASLFFVVYVVLLCSGGMGTGAAEYEVVMMRVSHFPNWVSSSLNKATNSSKDND